MWSNVLHGKVKGIEFLYSLAYIRSFGILWALGITDRKLIPYFLGYELTFI